MRIVLKGLFFIFAVYKVVESRGSFISHLCWLLLVGRLWASLGVFKIALWRCFTC